jgi:Fic family protein
MERLTPLVERANVCLGRLDGMAHTLPNIQLFFYMYIRKEAVLSSQIEGTQSSLSDLILHEYGEHSGALMDDVVEISTYVAALEHGFARLQEGFPLSLRLIREMHEILLSRGRGSDKQPGEFRTSQNWIGGTRPGNALFVPPPPHEVMRCMGDLEMFLHPPHTLPLVVRAALAHVQFETIHPFLDGNGRIGRLLISLLMREGDILQEPLLYLSLYLKRHRTRYYELLQEVRLTGAWEEWCSFFLEGVIETANNATDTARRILRMFEAHRLEIETLSRPATILRLHQWMQHHPLASIPHAAEGLNIAYATAATALNTLEKMGMVREITGQKRDRLFSYKPYMDILSEGTEPL